MPGVEHEKRYEDVITAFAAGIDVYSTVNVQHLESLKDQIAQLTGATVRETIPDAVLSDADEVVLVDLTPEALIARLRAGKVDRPERVQAALNNFFKIENLSALRETALRQVADEVEVKRLVRESTPMVRRDKEGLDGARRGSDRRRSPSACSRSARSARNPNGCPARVALGPAARRSARRAGGAPTRAAEASPEDRAGLEALRWLTSMLGGRCASRRTKTRRRSVVRVARAQRNTYILMGPPSGRKRFGRLSEPLLMRLMRGLPGVDVRVVSDPTMRKEADAGDPLTLDGSHAD